MSADSHHTKSNIVEIAQGLQQGELPSNERIETEIDKAKDLLDDKYKSAKRPDEARVYKDLSELLDTAELTLEEKNRDNLVQTFVADVQKVLENTHAQNSSATYLVEVAKTLNALRAMVFPIIKSQSFRQSIVDLFDVFRDMLLAIPDSVDTKQLKQDFVDGKNPVDAVQEDVVQPVKDEINSEEMQQKRKQTRKTLANIAQEIGRHPQSKEAYQQLLNLWGLLSNEFYAQLDRAKVDVSVQKVQEDAQKIFESFLGGKRLDDFLGQVRSAINVIQNDQELSNYFKDVRTYLQRAVDDPTVVDNKAYFDEGSALLERGSKFADKYKSNPEFQAIFDEAAKLALEAKNDDQMNLLKKKAAKVAADLMTIDKNGNRSVNTKLVNLLRAELIPFLTSRIKEVPIKGFSVSSPDFEYLNVDDIYLTIDDILPDSIKIRAESDMEINIESIKSPLKSYSYLYFKLEGIRPKIKDFHFSYKRRDAIIAEKDEGRASIKVTGAGLNAEIKFALDVNASAQVFMQRDAEIKLDVDNIDLDILEAKNNPVLLNVMTTLFKSNVQKEVEKGIHFKLTEYSSLFADTVNNQIFQKLSLPDFRAALIEKLE